MQQYWQRHPLQYVVIQMMREGQWITHVFEWVFLMVSRLTGYVMTLAIGYLIYYAIEFRHGLDAVSAHPTFPDMVASLSNVIINVGPELVFPGVVVMCLRAFTARRWVDGVLYALTSIAFVVLTMVLLNAFMNNEITKDFLAVMLFWRAFSSLFYTVVVAYCSGHTGLDLRSLLTELDSLREQVESGQHEVDTLQQQLSSGQQELDRVRVQLREREHEVSTLRAQLSSGQGELSTLRMQMQSALTEVDSLRVQVSTGQQQVDTLQQHLSNEQEMVSTLRVQVDTQQQEMSTLRIQLSSGQIQQHMSTGQQGTDEKEKGQDMLAQRIQGYRTAHPQATHKQIAEALDISEKTVQRKMRQVSSGQARQQECDDGDHAQRLRVVK